MRVKIPRWPATVKLSCEKLTKSECLIVKNNRVECTILRLCTPLLTKFLLNKGAFLCKNKSKFFQHF